MLIILSPAKTMDMSPVPSVPAGTIANFTKDAELIASRMSNYSREQLQLLLQISNKLTDINYERYQQFDAPDTPSKQAILAYTGSVFQHINPGTFSPGDYEYAQDHLRIISTLYGLLRPLDLIKAYRIAFKLKIKGLEVNDLYEYWSTKLTMPLIREVKQQGGILVNLASLDILGALNMEQLQKEVQIITPEFKELRKGKYETIRTYAKMARGEMTRYILTNRIEKPEFLKKFKWDGFEFRKELSDTQHYIYTK